MEPNFLNDDMTPYHIFVLFWDVIKHTVNMTHVCAAQKGNANFQVTAGELQWVLAILLISGYISLPSHRMFWRQADDVSKAAVSSLMSLN